MENRSILSKVLALITSIFMIATIIAGCGDSKNQTSQNAATSKKENIKITIWHYLNDRDKLMHEFAKEYEEKTGVKVDFQLYSGDQIGTKVQAAAQAKALPDAWVFAGGKGDLAKYVQAGNILNVSNYIKDWASRFPDNILAQAGFVKDDGFNIEPGMYGIPLDVNNMQFLYNKDLFKKAGLDPDNPPKTWSEFIEYGKKLKAAGITPFATGIGTWAGQSMTEPYQWAYVGEQKLKDSRAGKISFKDSGIENVFNLLVEMRNANMFANGSATMDLPTAEQMFVNGQVAMIFDGSWAVGVFNAMNPNFKNYGVFFPPKDERAPYEELIPGGIGAYFVVNKDSKYAKETVEFLKWLTDKEQQIKYANESFNLPANKDAVDPNKLIPQTAEFANDMDKVYSFMPPFKANLGEIFGKGIQMIVIGQKTPADIVKEMDVANK